MAKLQDNAAVAFAPFRRCRRSCISLRRRSRQFHSAGVPAICTMPGVSRHFNVPAFPPFFFYVPAFPRRRHSRHFNVWAFPHFPQRRSRHFHRGSVFAMAAFPPFAPCVLHRPGGAPLQPCDYGPPSPH
ncbi:unnamed protein product [Lampetra fluviatilis]